MYSQDCLPDHLSCEGKFHAHLLVVVCIVALVELLGVVTLAVVVRDGGSLDDVDQWRPDSVSGTHFIIQLQQATPGDQIAACLEG